MKAKGSAAANHHAHSLLSRSILYECHGPHEWSDRQIESGNFIRKHLEFVTNASHDHDSLSITGLEVGDGARHMSQKYQMVKHQLV